MQETVNDCCKDDLQKITDFINKEHDPEHPQSSLIAILHYAQGLHGYLRKDVMQHISMETEIPTAEIYGVATFYGYFKLKPTGKHMVSVCMGTACYVKGAAKIVEEIQDELDIETDETSADGLFTLVETRCIGACGLAPVLTVDDHVHGRLVPGQSKEILDSYRNNSE